MRRIEAVCLGHKERVKGTFQTIHELREEVFTKFNTYLVKNTATKMRVDFILTYQDKITNTEQELNDINIIPLNNQEYFRLCIKRVCFIIPFNASVNDARANLR